MTASERAVEENNAAGSSGTSGNTQSIWRRKRQPLLYDVTFKGEPFPPPPVEEYTPSQYFKHFFDDALIDHIVEQTNLYCAVNRIVDMCRSWWNGDVLGGAGNDVNHQIATNKDVLVQWNQNPFCGRCHVNQLIWKNKTLFSLQWQHQTSSSYSQGSWQTVQGMTHYQLFGGKMQVATSRGVPLCGWANNSYQELYKFKTVPAQ